MSESLTVQPYDIHGVPLRAGDIIRVEHFRTRRRRMVYMYKIVVMVNAESQVCDNGKYWYALDIGDLLTDGRQHCHRCAVEYVGRFEVVDGPTYRSGDKMICWWERKRVKQCAKT